MGFTATADDHYTFTGELYTLTKGLKALNKALMPMRVARMTPEERTKHELIMQDKANFIARKAGEKERRDDLLRMQQADRKEKATEEIKASKANHLGFGANLVTFKPPAGGG